MTANILTLVTTALFVFGIATTATAQTGAVLSGVVHDRTGQPVPGVVLTILNPGTTADARVVMTDQRGTYFVDRLDYGRQYAVEASHPRFRKSRVRASANEGEAPIHIMLHPRRTRLGSFMHYSWRALRLGLMEQPRAMWRFLTP